MRPDALVLAVLMSLGLAGCNRGGEAGSSATGRPGTGNPTEVARPSAPDTPTGDPSGVKGSLPGVSGGEVVPGATGSGTSGSGQAAQPGAGLAGGTSGSSGLGMTGTFPAGTATQSSGAGAAAGSSNRTPRSAVGTR